MAFHLPGSARASRAGGGALDADLGLLAHPAGEGLLVLVFPPGGIDDGEFEASQDGIAHAAVARGAGGAARAVVAGLAEKSHSISKVVIANRDVERAKELAKIGSGLGLKCETISLDKAQSVSPDSDLVVNATTLGINNEPSVIDYDHIKKDSIVYDIVYRPVTTSLIENAKYAEANVVYGYEMLVEQGAKAFEIWTGIQAPRDVMKKNLLGMFGETS